MTYKITSGVEWTDEDIDDIVLGSGAFSWEWWNSVSSNEEAGTYSVTLVEEYEEDMEKGTMTFTREDFVNTVRAVEGGAHMPLYCAGTGTTVAEYIRRDDLDADAVDSLIQITVLGETIFG